MKWIMLVVLGLAAVIAAIAAVGAMLPRAHKASRTLRLHRAPADVWRVVSETAQASSVPVDVLESNPPHRLVTRVKATERNFGGTWTIAIVPVPDPSTVREPQGRPEQGRGATGSGLAPSTSSGQAGSTVTITEDGWVANPIFRFMSRLVIGHHATMDALLKQVAKAFNEDAALSGE
jgi:hypothetical protein